MLILLSPAKSLDYATPLADGIVATAPQFVPQSSELIALLRQQTPQTLASLMKISDPLAALNVARYQAWTTDEKTATARPALLAFNGDVYDGLQARSLSADDLAWAQQHLAILSGLYGVLRPLDAMQPYRLEMGTRLATAKGANLYQFWGAQIAQYINAQLSGQALPLVLICTKGNRASRAEGIAKKLGYEKAQALAGGLKAWRDAGMPVEKA